MAAFAAALQSQRFIFTKSRDISRRRELAGKIFGVHYAFSQRDLELEYGSIARRFTQNFSRAIIQLSAARESHIYFAGIIILNGKELYRESVARAQAGGVVVLKAHSHGNGHTLVFRECVFLFHYYRLSAVSYRICGIGTAVELYAYAGNRNIRAHILRQRRYESQAQRQRQG